MGCSPHPDTAGWGDRPMSPGPVIGQDRPVQPPRPSSPTSRRVAELIELGRDREAAELAVAARSVTDNAGQIRGGQMEVLDQLDQLGPLLAAVVGGIGAEQLDNSTPCANFSVRGVLAHMVGGATIFAA